MPPRWRATSPARPRVVEADAVTEATGTRIAPVRRPRARRLPRPGGRGHHAHRGHDADATAGGQGIGVQYAHWANAILHNGLGRYERGPCRGPAGERRHAELFVAAWALTELVEAAVRSGNASWPPPRSNGSPRPRRQRDRLGAGDRGPLTRAARATARPPSACTARRSSASAARGCARSSPAPTCSTASGCAARAGASTRASSCAPRTSCSPRSAWRRSPSARARELLATGETVRKRTVETRDELTAQEAADRPARPRRPLQPGDRRPAVPQPPHGRVAPAQGVRQARDQLAHGPARRAAEPRPERRARVGTRVAFHGFARVPARRLGKSRASTVRFSPRPRADRSPLCPTTPIS